MSKTAAFLTQEITKITSELIQNGLCINQHFPSVREVARNEVWVDWGKYENLSVVFKDIEYSDAYNELEADQNYNIKMIDGALLQLMYKVIDDEVIAHRLAFFPSPYLEKFQNDPNLYIELESDIYADMLAKNVVPVPIRFDFDVDIHDEEHAKSHATFGQYKNCRIPVFGPLSPSEFVAFILRHFYSSWYRTYSLSIRTQLPHVRTISSIEEKLLHFNFTA